MYLFGCTMRHLFTSWGRSTGAEKEIMTYSHPSLFAGVSFLRALAKIESLRIFDRFLKKKKFCYCLVFYFTETLWWGTAVFFPSTPRISWGSRKNCSNCRTVLDLLSIEDSVCVMGFIFGAIQWICETAKYDPAGSKRWLHWVFSECTRSLVYFVTFQGCCQ